MLDIQKPIVPKDIVVHLGTPTSDAQNVTVPFPDYIKNVASSEIYPSWPENALRANIYAIVTFALNRIYTEWYRSKGYNFDITNSTQYDQAFVPSREIFENISQLVDEIFDDYVVKQGSVEPFFTQFCNGTTVTCEGLSQWGTVDLANQGHTPYQILQNYYGDDINIIKNAPIKENIESYPGIALSVGSVGNDVYKMQNRLNRIADNFPAIPKITPANGIFGVETEDAVKKFQEITSLVQDGIVGKSTWYKINYYYNSVKELGELTSEGISPEEARPLFKSIQEGDTGNEVKAVQYYLNIISYFNDELNPVLMDGYFGPITKKGVEDFQRYYGLPVDGVVDRRTFNKLISEYLGIVRSLSDEYTGEKANLYPGYFLTRGQSGKDVQDLQTYLALIGRTYTDLPEIPVTGYFGEQTENAVRAFQRDFGITENGVVGPITWDTIAKEYDAITLSHIKSSRANEFDNVNNQ